jgi:hypothetical protein
MTLDSPKRHWTRAEKWLFAARHEIRIWNMEEVNARFAS